MLVERSLRSLSVFAGVLLSCMGLWYCSSPTNKPTVKIYPSARIVQPKEGATVSLTIEALDKENKPMPAGSMIKLTASLGSFDKNKKDFREIQLKIKGSTGTVNIIWFAGTKEGQALIVAKSKLATSNSIIITIQKDALPPKKEPKKEAIQDAGVVDTGPIDQGGPVDTGKVGEVVRKDGSLGPKQAIFMTVKLSRKFLRADGIDQSLMTVRFINQKLLANQLKVLKIRVVSSIELLFFNTKTKKQIVPVSRNTIDLSYSGKGTLFEAYVRGVRPGTAEMDLTVLSKWHRSTVKSKIDIQALGFLEFVSAVPLLIGTQGSGNEVSSLNFRVLDVLRKPYPKNTKVFFSISNPIGGASITSSEALTNGKGAVATQLKSGRKATTISVTARVVTSVPGARCPRSCKTDTDCDSCGLRCHKGKCMKVIETTTPSIAIVGGRPNHRGMTFTCERRNIPAFCGALGNNIASNINTNCTVKLADRFTNKVGFPTQVLFMIEAGTIDATAKTEKWNTKGSGATGKVGTATVQMRTQNPPPKDVEPMWVPNVNNCKTRACTSPAAKGYWHPYNCTSKYSPKSQPKLYIEPWYKDRFGRIRNPRDGLVSILAYTDGEEAFTDRNDNGLYDKGEPFIDLGEPFLDANDDGVWQPNEQFVDIPCTKEQVAKRQNGCKAAGLGNGRRDGPNGKWDGNTLIWKRAWVLWSGSTATVRGLLGITPVVNFGSDNKTCKKLQYRSGLQLPPPKLMIIDPKHGYDFTFTAHDLNLNPLTSSKINYGIIKAKMIKSPVTDNAHPQGGYGFGLHTINKPGSFSAAITAFDYIVPASFFGLSQYSHHISLVDNDGSKDKKGEKELFSISVISACNSSLYEGFHGISY